MKTIIEIDEFKAEIYLTNAKIMMLAGVPEILASPYIVMVKGYGDDWDNYSELTFDDLDNDNVVDAGYEDYQLWLNDTLANLNNKGVLN